MKSFSEKENVSDTAALSAPRLSRSSGVRGSAASPDSRPSTPGRLTSEVKTPVGAMIGPYLFVNANTTFGSGFVFASATCGGSAEFECHLLAHAWDQQNQSRGYDQPTGHHRIFGFVDTHNFPS
jgi:hypothetical protein